MSDDDVLDLVVRTASLTTTAVETALTGGPGTDRQALLGAMDRAIAVLTSLRGHLLTTEKSRGAWAGTGDRSFEAWRARTARTGTQAAGAQVREAEALEAIAPARAALHEGAITPEHVAVLARLTSSGSPVVREAAVSERGRDELLAMARREDAGTFSRSAKRWAARQEPASLERSHERQRAERYLHVVPARDGVRVAGLLDDVAGHRLRLALEAVSGRPAVDDDRNPEQRRADALDAIASKVLDLPETARGAAVRPHVSLLMDAATWAALRGARRSGASTAATPPTEPVTLEDGTPVPMTEVARALCDCELTRVVMDADGVPVDLGRTERVYRNEQRRAVIARDRECAWPGCGMHARWGEVHHIRWWDRDDGATSVENGVLLCRFHHQEVHRHDLDITRHDVDLADPGRPRVRYEFRRPDGRLIREPDEPMRDGAPRTAELRPPDREVDGRPVTEDAGDRAIGRPPGPGTIGRSAEPPEQAAFDLAVPERCA